MKAFSDRLYQQMNSALRSISIEANSMLKQAEGSYRTVQEAMQELKNFILHYSFKDEQEEIYFFKDIKPRFLKELIFFEELYYIESGRPVASKKEIERYLNTHLTHINQFFRRNNHLYTYYLMGETYKDEQYFTRQPSGVRLKPDKYYLDMDTRFSTLYSFKLGRLQAYQKLSDYLQTALLKLDQNLPTPEIAAKPKLKWTAPKVSLIELVYAFKAAGVFNNGTANINEIATLLESAFQRDLSDFYRTFQEIRIRKKSRTAFMDLLQARLAQWMDDADQAG